MNLYFININVPHMISNNRARWLLFMLYYIELPMKDISIMLDIYMINNYYALETLRKYHIHIYYLIY